jgi:hypothetical protein
VTQADDVRRRCHSTHYRQELQNAPPTFVRFGASPERTDSTVKRLEIRIEDDFDGVGGRRDPGDGRAVTGERVVDAQLIE